MPGALVGGTSGTGVSWTSKYFTQDFETKDGGKLILLTVNDIGEDLVFNDN